MKTIDNTNIISAAFPHLENDEFVVVYVEARKKDGAEANKLFEAKFIRNFDEFEKVLPHLKTLARAHRARIYINLSPKSMVKLYHNVQLEMMRRIADSEPIKDPINIVYSEAGKLNGIRDKSVWVVDIDEEELSQKNEIRNVLYSQAESVVEIPTITGVHFLVPPFNTQFLDEHFIGLSDKIHKNSMGTLVFFEG